MKNIIFPFGLLVFSLFSLNVWAAPSSKICSQYGTFIGKDDRETSLYNLAIDNMCQDMEEDGTFRTGELWGGVWTRDVSYSIILSLAHVEPQYSKASLMRKVDRLGRIIQDTGTGGAWPVSVDREISTDPGVQHTVTVRIPCKGVYAVDWLYSNGNGEIETQNKCAVRTMCIDGERCDVVVLPQRGKDDWESQGWSNTVIVSLRRGRHTVEMSYPEENINMNIDEDRAVLHSVRFSRVK